MLRRVALLALVCACTQNFDAFDPIDAAPADDAPASEAGTDAAAEAAPTDAAEDVAPDVAPTDAAAEAEAGVPCTETGSVVYAGHCYFPIATTQSFNTAKAGCIAAGAHLVTITTSGEQTTVQALGTGERWIGLFRNGGPPKDQNYSWITGEGRNGFSKWSPGEPSGTGQCGTLLGTGLWNDQDCTQSLASICERE
ncbi:MAG TPA: C-type lectin domain-containing protein [Polyangiaceae bacterium]|jgi:hypothetical protein